MSECEFRKIEKPLIPNSRLPTESVFLNIVPNPLVTPRDSLVTNAELARHLLRTVQRLKPFGSLIRPRAKLLKTPAHFFEAIQIAMLISALDN
jgi:hypothetical protein